MPDEGLVEISASRLIPGQKWRVIRLLTKVWEFPTYMPNVKEATVIQKSRNKITTKWKIQVDNIPISWVEEETLALRESAIYFRAIEGDLEEFRGAWKFQDQPGGTLLTVNVSLRVDIPVIRDFAQQYIKKILTRNFEVMLESLEKRLISLRYISYKRGFSDKVAGFGIITHPYNFKHLETCFKMLNPDFVMPSQEFINQLFHISPSFKLYDILNFKSKSGQTVNGCLIMATFIPDMIENDIWAAFSKVVRACKIAEKHGMGIVALGGFTSIVEEKIGHDIAEEVDIPLTTGNTFTAAMVIDGVLKAAAILDLDLNKTKAAIVDGTGDLGIACARVLVGKVNQITIASAEKPELSRLRVELRQKKKAQVAVTTDNKEAVSDADIVIAAANVPASILDIHWFKPGAIICDVGYPKNISYTTAERDDILIFSGGLAKCPMSIYFPTDLGLPSADTIYGSFAEGIILALEKRYESFSFSKGKITPDKIEEIRDLGKIHGFEVSDFYWDNKLIDESMIARVKNVVQENAVYSGDKT